MSSGTSKRPKNPGTCGLKIFQPHILPWGVHFLLVLSQKLVGGLAWLFSTPKHLPRTHVFFFTRLSSRSRMCCFLLWNRPRRRMMVASFVFGHSNQPAIRPVFFSHGPNLQSNQSMFFSWHTIPSSIWDMNHATLRWTYRIPIFPEMWNVAMRVNQRRGWSMASLLLLNKGIRKRCYGSLPSLKTPNSKRSETVWGMSKIAYDTCMLLWGRCLRSKASDIQEYQIDQV